MKFRFIIIFLMFAFQSNFALANYSNILDGVERTFDPNYLYDQSSLGEKPTDDAVVAEFLSRKKSLLWTRCQQALLNAAGTAGTKILMCGGAAYAGCHYINNQMIAGATLVAAATQALESLGNVLEKSWQCFNEIQLNRKPDPLEELEIAYIKKKRAIRDPSLRTTIERKLTTDCRNDYTKATCEIFIKAALSLPTRNQVIDYDPQLIANNLRYYPKNITEALTDYCLNRYISQPSEFSRNPGKKRIAYFQGPPGTGKSEAAKLIAKSLKLPHTLISLAEATGGQRGVEKLTGTREGWGHGDPGLIADAIMGRGGNQPSVMNKVLILDDVDRVLNSDDKDNPLKAYMLLLADPETKELDHPYFNTQIDISNLIIIATGNFDIIDEAQRKRFDIFYFHGFEPDDKFRLVMEVFVQGYIDNMRPELQKYATLTDDDKQNLRRMVDEDKDPGLRTILPLAEGYIIKKVKAALQPNVGSSNNNPCEKNT